MYILKLEEVVYRAILERSSEIFMKTWIGHFGLVVLFQLYATVESLDKNYFLQYLYNVVMSLYSIILKL